MLTRGRAVPRPSLGVLAEEARRARRLRASPFLAAGARHSQPRALFRGEWRRRHPPCLPLGARRRPKPWGTGTRASYETPTFLATTISHGMPKGVTTFWSWNLYVRSKVRDQIRTSIGRHPPTSIGETARRPFHISGDRPGDRRLAVRQTDQAGEAVWANSRRASRTTACASASGSRSRTKVEINLSKEPFSGLSTKRRHRIFRPSRAVDSGSGVRLRGAPSHC